MSFTDNSLSLQILNNYFTTNLVQAIPIDNAKHIPGNAQTGADGIIDGERPDSAGMR